MTGSNAPNPGGAAERIDTLVIGGSQAGLSVSYYLTRAARPHVVLERDRIGSNWLSDRWDSFTLVTPNWMNRLPDFPYRGADPDGFLARDEIVAYLEAFAASFGPPLRFGVTAERLALLPEDAGYFVETNQGAFLASNVVITVGFFHRPKIPAFAGEIAPSIAQLSSSGYKNPESLPPGAALVVGSAQSGCQIAEELMEAGRKVFLSVSRAVREPRRYRGKDANHWFDLMGGFDRGFADPKDPVERYNANPHNSGKNGGHALNLENFAARGMVLLGRTKGAKGTAMYFENDLTENVPRADKASRDFQKEIDDFIAAQGPEAPPADADNSDDGQPAQRPKIEEIPEIDLAKEGISSIIWATGFAGDYSWVELPILDARGYPDQQRGVSRHPGLYFCGLHRMYSLKSGLLFGVGEAAEGVVRHLTSRPA